MSNKTLYYPDQKGALSDPELFDAHKQTLDLLHDARAQIAYLQKQVAAMKPTGQGSTQGGAITTTINGIVVRASVPTDGQKLQYVAKDNQIEWV